MVALGSVRRLIVIFLLGSLLFAFVIDRNQLETSVAQNDCAVRPVTALELAYFSQFVNRDDAGSRVFAGLEDFEGLEESEWQLLLFSDQANELGYFGAVYISRARCQVVVAHRGDDLFMMGSDADAELAAALGHVEVQFTDGVTPFLNQVGSDLSNQGLVAANGWELTHTGHGMGAVLAELSAAYLSNTSAVTFDSPGSYGLIETIFGQDVAAAVNLVSYMGPPNLVNTATRHSGDIVLLDPTWREFSQSGGFRSYRGIEPSSARIVGSIANYIDYSIAAHDLDRMILQFDVRVGQARTPISVNSWWPQTVMDGLWFFVLTPDRPYAAPMGQLLTEIGVAESAESLAANLAPYAGTGLLDTASGLFDLNSLVIVNGCGFDDVCIDMTVDACFVPAENTFELACMRGIAAGEVVAAIPPEDRSVEVNTFDVTLTPTPEESGIEVNTTDVTLTPTGSGIEVNTFDVTLTPTPEESGIEVNTIDVTLTPTGSGVEVNTIDVTLTPTGNGVEVNSFDVTLTPTGNGIEVNTFDVTLTPTGSGIEVNTFDVTLTPTGNGIEVNTIDVTLTPTLVEAIDVVDTPNAPDFPATDIETEQPDATSENMLDIILVIDTTSSMGDDISAVKREAVNIINRVTESGTDWRIGIVTYRDHPIAPYGDPTDYAGRVDLEFTNDRNAIVNTVNLIAVDGGGDEPEAVFSGLMTAIAFPWRDGARKAIILIGDAPPHDPEPRTDYTMSQVLRAAFDVDSVNIYAILIENSESTRLAFQSLADGSSGQLFNASSADVVVDTIFRTITSITEEQELISVLDIGSRAVVYIPDEQYGLRLGPGREYSLSENLEAGTPVEIIGEPEFNGVNIWWPIRSLVSGYEGWTVEAVDGIVTLIPDDDATASTGSEVDCTISAGSSVNRRAYPSTSAPITRQLAGGTPIAGVGTNLGGDGFIWYWLEDGSWIRSDVVSARGECDLLPTVRPWLNDFPAASGFEAPGVRTVAPPNSSVLNGGVGLSNGAVQNNGDIQVEGYCNRIGYGISTNEVDWFCTMDNNQPAFTLGARDFDAICRETYDNPRAVAIQDGSGSAWAFRWRCHEVG